EHVLRFCTVEINQSSDEAFPNLCLHHMPIIKDSVALRFTHLTSKKTCCITRT
ncbi:hypothetical protein C8R48DRAFT_600283, partial [Suillus tomentosus]